jgi:hypothetical protein
VRTTIHACTVAAIVACAGGCDFTEFDSLSNTTWAHATTKPSVSSSDWGIAMTPAAYSGQGGELLVIGADTPTFATITYAANGGTSLGPGAIDLNVQFAINAIPDQPIVISDPSGTVALVIPTGDGRTLVEGGPDATKPAQLAVLGGDGTPGGATFFPVGGSGGALEIAVTGIGTKTGSAVSANFHLVPLDASAPSTCPADLPDGTGLDAVALAYIPPPLGSAGTFLAWNSDGSVATFDAGSAVATCSASTGATTITAQRIAGAGSAWGSGSLSLGLPQGFAPVQGEIAVVPYSGSGDQYAILAGHTDPSAADASAVIVLDVTAGTIVGAPMTGLTSLRGFAFGALGDPADGSTYVALGFPLLDVGGTASAGQVQIFAFDTQMGIAGTPVQMGGILSDDQPSDNELFGRSLAFMSFNGKQILVVGASNEIFSYYQTQIYGDTRN